MLNRMTGQLNRIAGQLNRPLERNKSALLVAALFAAGLLGIAWAIGITRFSPDSWAYFELAKTVLSGHFYQFNTVRSYFSNEYSSSFPLGYSTALAIVQAIAGQRPFAAVILNIGAVAATAVLIFQLGAKIQLPGVARLALVAALLLYPEYLDEVFSGRSIPLAILALLGAGYLQLSQQAFSAGLLLGISALIRFDCVVYAILFQFAVQVCGGFKPKQAVSMALGFLLGALPWVIYSYSHFGKIWISDNSWVAMSALPVYFADYPAAAQVTAFDQPLAWLARVAGNIIPLLRTVSASVTSFPIAALSAIFFIWNFLALNNGTRFKTLAALAILAASLGPYLLTGYFNPRYFALPLLCASIIFLYATRDLKQASLAGLDLSALALIAFLLSILGGSLHLTKDIRSANALRNEMNAQADQIAALHSCHMATPGTLFIFHNKTGLLASKYGALTGMRAAIAPSNFDRMSAPERSAYLENMKPYFSITDPAEIRGCIAQ